MVQSWKRLESYENGGGAEKVIRSRKSQTTIFYLDFRSRILDDPVR